MPLLRVLSRRPLHLSTLRCSPRPSRPFSSQTALLVKEDKPHDPEHLESVKQSQLKKQEKGEGHWHEELASSGESHVKADREKVDDHGEHMEELQKHTKGKAEKGEI
ncbi:hypothetical protein EV356DRAFT_499928 [Viridothelium virens]|uniref:Uncharacterized protein n=1 Tax=Viridothelium virens TaxID=1048519 RepID=A0A6A6HNU9_VIRVR|nr:hypothetical protein EV356DRAFT_499928 [Viridothelium virens]